MLVLLQCVISMHSRVDAACTVLEPHNLELQRRGKTGDGMTRALNVMAPVLTSGVLSSLRRRFGATSASGRNMWFVSPSTSTAASLLRLPVAQCRQRTTSQNLRRKMSIWAQRALSRNCATAGPPRNLALKPGWGTALPPAAAPQPPTQMREAKVRENAMQSHSPRRGSSNRHPNSPARHSSGPGPFSTRSGPFRASTSNQFQRNVQEASPTHLVWSWLPIISLETASTRQPALLLLSRAICIPAFIVTDAQDAVG